jgi:hypothetical protein
MNRSRFSTTPTKQTTPTSTSSNSNYGNNNGDPRVAQKEQPQPGTPPDPPAAPQSSQVTIENPLPPLKSENQLSEGSNNSGMRSSNPAIALNQQSNSFKTASGGLTDQLAGKVVTEYTDPKGRDQLRRDVTTTSYQQTNMTGNPATSNVDTPQRKAIGTTSDAVDQSRDPTFKLQPEGDVLKLEDTLQVVAAQLTVSDLVSKSLNTSKDTLDALVTRLSTPGALMTVSGTPYSFNNDLFETVHDVVFKDQVPRFVDLQFEKYAPSNRFEVPKSVIDLNYSQFVKPVEDRIGDTSIIRLVLKGVNTLNDDAIFHDPFSFDVSVLVNEYASIFTFPVAYEVNDATSRLMTSSIHHYLVELYKLSLAISMGGSCDFITRKEDPMNWKTVRLSAMVEYVLPEERDLLNLPAYGLRLFDARKMAIEINDALAVAGVGLEKLYCPRKWKSRMQNGSQLSTTVTHFRDGLSRKLQKRYEQRMLGIGSSLSEIMSELSTTVPEYYRLESSVAADDLFFRYPLPTDASQYASAMLVHMDPRVAESLIQDSKNYLKSITHWVPSMRVIQDIQTSLRTNTTQNNVIFSSLVTLMPPISTLENLCAILANQSLVYFKLGDVAFQGGNLATYQTLLEFVGFTWTLFFFPQMATDQVVNFWNYLGVKLFADKGFVPKGPSYIANDNTGNANLQFTKTAAKLMDAIKSGAVDVAIQQNYKIPIFYTHSRDDPIRAQKKYTLPETSNLFRRMDHQSARTRPWADLNTALSDLVSAYLASTQSIAAMHKMALAQLQSILRILSPVYPSSLMTAGNDIAPYLERLYRRPTSTPLPYAEAVHYGARVIGYSNGQTMSLPNYVNVKDFLQVGVLIALSAVECHPDTRTVRLYDDVVTDFHGYVSFTKRTSGLLRYTNLTHMVLNNGVGRPHIARTMQLLNTGIITSNVRNWMNYFTKEFSRVNQSVPVIEQYASLFSNQKLSPDKFTVALMSAHPLVPAGSPPIILHELSSSTDYFLDNVELCLEYLNNNSNYLFNFSAGIYTGSTPLSGSPWSGLSSTFTLPTKRFMLLDNGSLTRSVPSDTDQDGWSYMIKGRIYDTTTNTAQPNYIDLLDSDVIVIESPEGLLGERKDEFAKMLAFKPYLPIYFPKMQANLYYRFNLGANDFTPRATDLLNAKSGDIIDVALLINRPPNLSRDVKKPYGSLIGVRALSQLNHSTFVCTFPEAYLSGGVSDANRPENNIKFDLSRWAVIGYEESTDRVIGLDGNPIDHDNFLNVANVADYMMMPLYDKLPIVTVSAMMDGRF